ncbi:kinase-like domain-containing protein [Cantharellus anzutake]|uniref:kinase-like domain-containing protein n=1 Tax=Cantharellus anzutake TaxID=1750568 RepID=UPI0019056615|nr:kinase-like domain-containing protein [Cantharellus anzutake]KAF8324366.1 kinase-like domain-containing protein [Cantharellus anzutake]
MNGMETSPLALLTAEKHAQQFRYEMARRGVRGDVTDMIDFNEEKAYIAGGSYSHVESVWYYGDDGTRRKVCLKTLHLATTPNGERFLREGKIWSSLNHPNVTPFYGWALHVSGPDVHACFVSQLCTEGSLRKYLRFNPNVPKSKMIREIAAGLLYLHDRGLVHGDVKPTNVLVNFDGRAMLCDFGLSMAIDDSSTHPIGSSIFTTVQFSAPELVMFEDQPPPRTKSSDVWAFGCTAMEVLSGRKPYEWKHTLRIPDEMKKGVLPFREFRSNSRLETILQYCFAWSPNHRPTMSQVYTNMLS